MLIQTAVLPCWSKTRVLGVHGTLVREQLIIFSATYIVVGSRMTEALVVI